MPPSGAIRAYWIRSVCLTASAALAAALPQDLPPVLAEPHAAWVDALEQEWLRRYGTH